MAAAFEAIVAIPNKSGVTRALTLTDYKAWASADLDRTHRRYARDKHHKKIWKATTEVLNGWAKTGEKHGDHGLTRIHVNSHRGGAGAGGNSPQTN